MTPPLLSAICTMALTGLAMALLLGLFRDDVLELFPGASVPKAGGGPRLAIVTPSEPSDAGAIEDEETANDTIHARTTTARDGGQGRNGLSKGLLTRNPSNFALNAPDPTAETSTPLFRRSLSNDL